MTGAGMPHGLRQLVDAAGVEAAVILVRERGGSRLEIPRKAEGSVLAGLVGIDAARAIVEALAGERLTVPLAKRFLNERMREQGWSQERRAIELRASRRCIQNWDSGNTPSLQIDLFEG